MDARRRNSKTRSHNCDIGILRHRDKVGPPRCFNGERILFDVHWYFMATRAATVVEDRDVKPNGDIVLPTNRDDRVPEGQVVVEVDTGWLVAQYECAELLQFGTKLVADQRRAVVHGHCGCVRQAAEPEPLEMRLRVQDRPQVARIHREPDRLLSED